MTTPSPARQAAEAWEHARSDEWYEDNTGKEITLEAFKAGAAWMNEQCAKECEEFFGTDWDDSANHVAARIHNYIRALNAGSEP